MKAYTKRKKLFMVMLCIVLVTVMLAVMAYISLEILKGGLSLFSDFEKSSLIHHGAVPSGYTECEEYYDDKGFMDHTDYCKYFYTEEDDDLFTQDDRYKKVKKKDIKNIKGYFRNCSSHMGNQERGADFDFDDQCISAGDYVYIETKEGEKFETEEEENSEEAFVYGKYYDYSVYLYDKESHTLYYVHNDD